eukprot:gene3018-3578_t
MTAARLAAVLIKVLFCFMSPSVPFHANGTACIGTADHKPWTKSNTVAHTSSCLPAADDTCAWTGQHTKLWLDAMDSTDMVFAESFEGVDLTPKMGRVTLESRLSYYSCAPGTVAQAWRAASILLSGLSPCLLRPCIALGLELPLVQDPEQVDCWNNKVDGASCGGDWVYQTVGGYPEWTQGCINGHAAMQFRPEPSREYFGKKNGNVEDQINIQAMTWHVVLKAHSVPPGAEEHGAICFDGFGKDFDVGLSSCGWKIQLGCGSCNQECLAPWAADTEPHLLTIVSDGSSKTLYVDGCLAHQWSEWSTGGLGSFPIIGSCGTTGEEAWDGCIGEIMAYSSALLVEDILQNEMYLANKWHLAHGTWPAAGTSEAACGVGGSGPWDACSACNDEMTPGQTWWPTPMPTPQQTPLPTPETTRDCMNDDNLVDCTGDTCSAWYDHYPEWCPHDGPATAERPAPTCADGLDDSGNPDGANHAAHAYAVSKIHTSANHAADAHRNFKGNTCAYYGSNPRDNAKAYTGSHPAGDTRGYTRTNAGADPAGHTGGDPCGNTC